jgi:glycosyltransferase involved in cell wall biosynthesis
MTVGYWSPMPPARTGVADYSSALVRAMRASGTVKLNDERADIGLYHIGNNPLHRAIYQQALAHPGVVVLHDAVLQHFFLGGLGEREYVAEFEYNYGAWSAGLGERLWRNRARSGTDPAYFEYPMLKRVVERARAVVVHNPGAARMVRQHVPEAAVFEIPHLLLRLPERTGAEVTRVRAHWGIPPVTCLFGVFGHLRESKRVVSVLRAFAAARSAGARVALLLAGEFVSRDLARALDERLQDAGILRVGYAPESEFGLYAQAVDACVNLRYPAAGETSGIAIRLMGVGKPVVVTDGEEVSRFSETATLRVDSGRAEVEMLTEYMMWLARFPGDARAIGAAGRRYVECHHAPERVAAQYWEVLRKVCA